MPSAAVLERVQAAPRRDAGGWTGRASLLVVLAAFALSQLVVLVAASISHVDGFDAANYVRWDSTHYLAIASDGYDLHHCDPSSYAESPYTRHDWCGNAGWFPGYPAAVAVAGELGLSPETAGMLLSQVAHLAVLAALWFWFLRDRPRRGAILALALAAVFPGFIYLDAVFPVAITLVSMLASLHLLTDRRWLAAGVAGTVAVVCYPSGILLAAVGCFAALAMHDVGSWRERARAAAAYTAPLLAAYAAVLVAFAATVRRWNAWFLTQRHYGYAPTLFVDVLARRCREIFPISSASWPPAQTVLVAVIVVAVLAAAWRRRAALDARELVLAAYTCVLWVVPLSLGGELSVYRAEALLIPAAALTWRLPRRLQGALVVAGLVIGVAMTVQFFDGTLI